MRLLRTLVHSDLYTAQLELLGDIKRLDDVLCAVEWSLARNPNIYGIVRGMRDVRLLKTDPHNEIPALRIWFSISDNGDVHLLYIERSQQEES